MAGPGVSHTPRIDEVEKSEDCVHAQERHRHHCQERPDRHGQQDMIGVAPTIPRQPHIGVPMFPEPGNVGRGSRLGFRFGAGHGHTQSQVGSSGKQGALLFARGTRFL